MNLLITDLDNTLYDWVAFHSRAFRTLVSALAELLEVGEPQLLAEFKVVHQRYGNSEQPYAALELPSVRARFGELESDELANLLSVPFQAFDSAREQYLSLYESVFSTLEILRERGVRIVGHTEAIAVNAIWRLERLGILPWFARLYASEGRSSWSPPMNKPSTLSAGFVRMVPAAHRKPNPHVVRDICAKEGFSVSDTWYVGDSLTKDIGMAKSAGTIAVWARYGARYDAQLWDLLVKVTHWTDEDVAREARLKANLASAIPDYTIDRFDELLALIPDERTGPPRRAIQTSL